MKILPIPSPKWPARFAPRPAELNRYAFMHYDDVTEQIADFHNVKPEQVLFGCGSTELLRVAACAYLGPDRKLIQAVPTFEAIAA